MPITVIISKLYSNKLMLPVGVLVSCFLHLSKEFQVFDDCVRTHVFLFEFNMILPLWITVKILRSGQMNKGY